MTLTSEQAIAAHDNGYAHIYWWRAGTLFNAQRGGIDPSEIYTSTDLPDALEQVGYDAERDVVHAGEAPDLETEIQF